MTTHPEDSAILDAIFQVAGGEGFRDLIQLYGGEALEKILSNTKLVQPTPLAFVDIHTRSTRDSSGQMVEEKYEVWCPGRSFARAYLNQCQIAAQILVQEHRVNFVPTLREERLRFPHEISTYMNQFLQNINCAHL